AFDMRALRTENAFRMTSAILPGILHAAHETLRGFPPGRKPDEREDAGGQEGIRGGRFHRGADGAFEWQRGLRRARGPGSSDRAQGGGGDEEAPRKRLPHHRTASRGPPENARLRSLSNLPAEARRKARGHVPARKAGS